MTHKILLKFDQQTRAAAMLDQIVRARLKQIQEGLAAWRSDHEIQAACLALLDWMGKQNAED